MAPVGLNPANSQYQLGSYTLGQRKASVQGMNKTQTIDLGMISQLNSPQAGKPGESIDANKAKDFQGIRAAMTEQPQNRSLIGKIADFIVNAKINKAAQGELA